MYHAVILLAIFVLTVSSENGEIGRPGVGNPLVGARPCNGSEDIVLSYEVGRPRDEENMYYVYIRKKLAVSSKIIFKFDTDARVTLSEKPYARVSVNSDNSFQIRFLKPRDGIGFNVQGLIPGAIPYLTSLTINTKEYCSKPWVGVLDNYLHIDQQSAETHSRRSLGHCGQRKVTHTELIVNGASTKPGDWPWHVAIYRIDRSNIKYTCGGTLISENYVLTAAHCVTLRGVRIQPESLSVVLGKFNLIGGDTEDQERAIYQIIIHDQFDTRLLENDIALLKLRSVAIFNDYIQPACIWYPEAVDKLSNKDIYGTVVGWGFENTDVLAPQLRKTKMPLVSDSTCIQSDPLFYTKLLKENKRFCAGYHNGTSACNGDSGSAFLVFVPEKAFDDNPEAAGAWYVRGIVSVTIARADQPICNPEAYGVFTDVEKYKTWIEDHTK